MSDQPQAPIPPTTPAQPALTWQWRIRHSAWLLAVVLGVGSFSFIGFLYCAIRIRSRNWWKIAAVVGLLTAIGWVLLLTPTGADGEATAGAGYVAALWIGLVVYGFVVNRDYLAWRATQVRPTKRTSVVPQAPVQQLTVPPQPTPNPGEAPAAQSVTDPQPLAAQDMRAPSQVDSPVSEVDRVSGVDATESEGETVATWQQAEALAAWHMTRLGFADAALTASGADGGIDVRGSNAVAQVKHHNAAVGAPAVQQLRGAAHGHDFALFYALSGYTKAALDYADDAEVALFAYDASGHVEPASMAARLLQRNAGGPDGIDIKEFELKVKAQRLGQELFDKVTAEFFDVGHQALALANSNPHSAILASTRVEMERVKQIIQYVGGNSLPIEEFMDEADRIAAATERLRMDLARQG